MDKKIKCPTCKRLFLDFDREPVPGDFTVCNGCGEILIIDKDHNIKKPTMADLNNVPGERMQKILMARGEIINNLKNKKP